MVSPTLHFEIIKRSVKLRNCSDILLTSRSSAEHSNKHVLRGHSIIYVTGQGWVGVVAGVTLFWSIVLSDKLFKTTISAENTSKWQQHFPVFQHNYGTFSLKFAHPIQVKLSMCERTDQMQTF